LHRTSMARQAPATHGFQAAVYRNRKIRMISGIGIPRSQSKIGMMFLSFTGGCSRRAIAKAAAFDSCKAGPAVAKP
jgi:hypothetical protein